MRNRGSLRGALAALGCLAALGLGLGCEGEDELTPESESIQRIPATAPVEPLPEDDTELPQAPEVPGSPREGAATPGAGADTGAGGAVQAASADPAEGAEIYEEYCASCHGARGRGDGPAGMALDPRPVSHANGTYMNSLSNEHLFSVIKSGGTAVGKSPLMPPWGGSLSDEQIWDVVAHVRTLAEPAYAGPMP